MAARPNHSSTAKEAKVEAAASKAVPKPKAQRNFTDPDARIMKTSDGAWTASRPMFLNSISLDVVGLTLAEERAGVLFQPFMQNFVDRDVDSKVQNNQRDVKVSNWVVKGQGFAVSWRPVRGSSAATEESPIDPLPPGVPESTADLGSE